MEQWISASKLVILFYCVLRYYVIGTKSIPQVVLFVLIYISANAAIYLVKYNKFKKALLFLLIIIIVRYLYYLDPIFTLLLPISIFELFFDLTDIIFAPMIIALIPLYFLDINMKIDYISIMLISYIVYISCYKYTKRIQKILKENDYMRERIHSLSTRLNKNSDYEMHIRYLSRLEERNKLSQEIHDKIGHAMSGSTIQLEAAKLFLNKDNKKSEEIIERVINILRDGTESIRASLKNIKPPSEQIGINRVKILLEEFSVNNNIKTTLLNSENLDVISSVQWKVIGDNIGEALTNALKYSRASLISVNIQVLGKFIKAEIRDNGIGADNIKKSLGLIGMEERCSGVGGKVIFDGSKGFSIINLLPLEIQ
jgi:signal transduction histidine kinase